MTAGAKGVLPAFEAALDSTADEVSRSGSERLISVTVPVEVADPSATVFASRLADDEWFCWAEPDRGFQLAGLGCAKNVTGRGPDRFRTVDAACADLMQGARIAGHGELDRSGVGPVWMGGFGFDPDGGDDHQWSSFPPASMTLPEISLVRFREGAFVTVNAVVGTSSNSREEALARIRRRVDSLRFSNPLPMLDPHPTVSASIEGRYSPEHFEGVVSEAVRRLRAQKALKKVVVAREIRVTSGSAHSPDALFGALREGFPSCFVFCRGTREGAFVGASPELLVRRSGASAATVALAGSTRRSSDPAMDDHLAEGLRRSEKNRHEQRIVSERIVRSLAPLSVWVESEPEPIVVKIANVQHLGTPVMAQLADAHTAVELAGRLHPTPAVGGEPWGVAAPVVSELEGIDRGWYAGPLGWMDSTGDGEFCVALRSALVRDRTAHLYAGVGIVEDSDPAEELAETELKLAALLPLFES